ncbi:MAG: peptidylprolyl isomerase, partial [Pseudomonadota bacterium]
MMRSFATQKYAPLLAASLGRVNSGLWIVLGIRNQRAYLAWNANSQEGPMAEIKDPENTILMELKDGTVTIELLPDVA